MNMPTIQAPTIHASAVLVGARAILIQGPSGAGKSRLAMALLQAAGTGLVPFARLVADDRCHVEAVHGRLLVRPAPSLAGMIEVRGFGIRQLPHESAAIVGMVVDLDAPEAARLPSEASQETTIGGVRLRRLAVPTGADPLPLVLAALKTNTEM